MWYTVLFVVSASGGNLDSLAVSPTAIPYEDCREFVNTRNNIMGSTGFGTVPGYRSMYACVQLQKLEEVIAQHQCSAVGIDAHENDYLYECKSQARAPTIQVAPVTRSNSAPPAVPVHRVDDERHSLRPSDAAAGPQTSPTSKEVAIQIASFSDRARAQALMSALTRAGHQSFVMAVTAGSSVLYRVRVGPFTSREAAAAALANIEVSNAIPAIVAHP